MHLLHSKLATYSYVTVKMAVAKDKIGITVKQTTIRNILNSIYTYRQKVLGKIARLVFSQL
jgi:hypothetical protein